jgi:hypothetical protein
LAVAAWRATDALEYDVFDQILHASNRLVVDELTSNFVDFDGLISSETLNNRCRQQIWRFPGQFLLASIKSG